VGDEAYYWDWSRQLAWGYYSKPPMVAWLIAAVTHLGGHHAEVIRTLAALFTTGSVALGYLLARDLFGARTGTWFVAVCLLAPAAMAQNLIFTIDAPLLFFWSAALWCFRRWLDAGQAAARFRWGTGLAVSLGLGLLTKQMMLVFPLLALLHLATSPQHRARLRQAGFWVIMLAGASALVPLLWWNAHHDWITIQHTAHHFQGAPFSILAALGRVAEFVAGEVALAGFVIGAIALAVLGAALRGMLRRELNEAERFLFWFCGPALIAMGLLALRQRLNLNWPLVFTPPLLILAVQWSLPDAKGHRRLRIGAGLRAGVFVSGAITLLACAYPLMAKLPGIAGGPADLTLRLRGWDTLAGEVDATLAELRTVSPSPSVPTLTYGHRYVTSQLAFNLQGNPQVWRWPTVPGAVESQYEVWDDLGALRGRDVLIVHQVDRRHPGLPDALRESFVSIYPIRSITVPLGASRERRYALYFGRNFQLATHED
jgi:4-amino-4-deoxy-L-arabinose transferase-like glycosyltransferase